MFTKATTPYFPSNRDDSDFWYQRGFEHGKKNWPQIPPKGKQLKVQAYLRGYEAGKFRAENA